MAKNIEQYTGEEVIGAVIDNFSRIAERPVYEALKKVDDMETTNGNLVNRVDALFEQLEGTYVEQLKAIIGE